MVGSTIHRRLRALQFLPLRRETVIHLALDPQATGQPTLNRLIGSDPALALAALGWAPRPFREGKLGIAQLARFAVPSAVLELARESCQECGPPTDEAATSMARRIWVHSIAVAHASRYVSQERGYRYPQAAFLAGLLHNLGLLAVSAVAPESVAELIGNLAVTRDALAEEKKLWGASHITIGHQLAKRWELPRWVCEVVWWHHQEDDSAMPHLADEGLVKVVREADVLVAGSQFALGAATDVAGWTLPWKTGEPSHASIARGVRQTSTYLLDHPMRDSKEPPRSVLLRAVDLAIENSSLHSTHDWRDVAWDRYNKFPPDGTSPELTGPIAETFSRALNCLGAMCYVLNADGSLAEGTLWCDSSRTVTCKLEQGKDALPHSDQVVRSLRPTWQQRPFQRIDLNWADETLGHVLLWTDEYGPAPCSATLAQLQELCTIWLARAEHVSRLEAQVETLATSLRDQAGEAEDRLENAKLAALAEMAAGAGHEINNPLAVISGRAQLLLAEENDPRRRKYLETIVGQAQRIHRMIVDLMFFARPPAPDCRPVMISEVIERAIGSLRREADDTNVGLVVSVSPDCGSVNGDLGQLAGALECIVRNAIEASTEGNEVRIGAVNGPNSTLIVKVCDSGSGISQEQRSHIFEPFYSGKSAGRGLGMGLPKAWRIVHSHGGEIVVESSAAGTTMTVQLPALQAPAEQERACA